MALLEELQPSQVQKADAAQDIIRKEEITWFPQTPEDVTILKIVTQDARNAEVGMPALLSEWQECDNLYRFFVPQYYWDNGVPRAALGMPLVLEHTESILPQVMTGLFQNEEHPFQSNPRPGTPMDAARANDALLSWELTEAGFREQVRLMFKSALVYGNGIAKLGWVQRKKKVTQYVQKGTPRFVGANFGGMIQPSSEDEWEAREIEVEENHPTFEYVDLRHILVDPGLRCPDIRKARFVIHRLYLTAEDLDALRTQPGYKNIPERSKLGLLFIEPKEVAVPNPLDNTALDVSKEFAAPKDKPTTVDPLKQPLKVDEYWTPERVYAVLQDKVVIRNDVNEFGEIPFRSLCCVDVLNQFWGFGIAKLIGGEQHLQQGVNNTFLDDLSLSLMGMFLVRRGSNVPTQQLRVRPGGMIQADCDKGENITNAVSLMQRQGLPIQETMAVLQASDARAQRRTAASEIAVQGSMPSDKSSITRTATGASLLGSATGTRIQGNLIEGFADQVFIPTLELFHKMNPRKLKPSQIQQILSKELNLAYSDVSAIVNSNVKFSILAAAKLQAKRALAMSLPPLLQLLMSEPIHQALMTQGKKVDYGEVINMMFDVSGWPNKQSVIVDMNPDDQARAMMSNPGIQQMLVKQASQSQQQSFKQQNIEDEAIAGAGRDVIKTFLEMLKLKSEPQKEPESDAKPATKD